MYVLGAKRLEATDHPIMQFPTAQQNCEERGGNLMSFASENEMARMAEAATDIARSYWTGLKYTLTTQTWSFADGTDTTFALGMISHSSTYYGDQCVLINGNRKLQVVYCAEKRAFICQFAS